ncbi:hypothetical protein HDU92_003117 [Lobulomyces angularis]|nr:hypothetical protein HDU92_003117 [Lobulomyces angularis]
MVVSTDSHNNTDIIDQLTKQNKELLERLESVELKLKENLELELHQSKVESNDLILSLSKFEQEKKLRQENFTQALNSLRTDDNKILDTPYRKARLLLGQDEVINLQGEELKDMISGLIDKIDEQDDLITRSENTKLKENNCNIQRFVEQEEEFISNKLLKRISLLKKEKSDLLMKLEQEEEMITNNLQKKLQKLQKEKIDMELSLEMEQEFIVNRLQKQLKSLMDQNSSGISTPLKISIQQQSHPLHSPSSSYNDLLPSVTPSILEILRSEVATYKGDHVSLKFVIKN